MHEDVTDEYEAAEGFPVSPNGTLAGFFYVLLIQDIHSSDSGYYLCQISMNNSFQSSFLNISIGTELTDGGCSSVD